MKWHVYFIQQDITNCIKIGKARNIQKRFRALVVGSPYKLRILGLIDPGLACGEKLEKYLHKLFEEFRLEGEWFKEAPALLEFASRYPFNENKIVKLELLLESLPELKRKMLETPNAYSSSVDPNLTAEEQAQQTAWINKMVTEGRARWNGYSLEWLTSKKL